MADVMIRRGVEVSPAQVEQGGWNWRFQIAAKITPGTTEANPMGIVAHLIKPRIVKL